MIHSNLQSIHRCKLILFGTTLLHFSFHGKSFNLRKISPVASQNLFVKDSKFTKSSPSSLVCSSILHQTRQNDPTSLFNKDISRIISPSSNQYYYDSYEKTYTDISIPQKENKYAKASEANSMLQQMIDLYQSGHQTVQPNCDTFMLVMRAYFACSYNLDAYFTPISHSSTNHRNSS